MRKIAAFIVVTLAASVLLLAPAQGHNSPGSINAREPGLFSGNVYGRAQYVLNNHPQYKVTAWLQRRLPGGSWSSVTSSTRISSDGYASTALVARNCRYDYRSLGEGWAWNTASGYHAYAQDLTSPILFHTC